ncbi:MAG: hypothetical protein IK134_10145 [Oscillospiraceae bacterium]|nr:hypothetical protein [Oscillospiraceae bacterium]
MRKIIAGMLFCGLLLCGCGEKPAPESSAETVPETTTAAATTATVSETEPEITSETVTTAPPEQLYMNRCEKQIVEVQPDEILERREDVVYPEFEKYYYYSHTACRRTGVNVLLPADYTDEKRYPVLYILHGSGDTEDWIAEDRVCVSVMLNNLITDGEAEEMIVVSPYIYCSKDMPECTGLDPENWRNFDRFAEDLMRDLRPFINSTFSVAEDRAHTAITGCSAGGRVSLTIGFTHPDVFGFTGAVCPASGVVREVGNPPYTLEPAQFCFPENRPYLLLISAAEHDEAVLDYPYQYHDMLTENGTQHLFHVMTQSGHDYHSVISHLYNFMRMIFRVSE